MKNIVLVTQPFQEMGILTTTFKLKRHNARLHFAKQIDMMYSEGAQKKAK